jgi:hypothetical protein
MLLHTFALLGSERRMLRWGDINHQSTARTALFIKRFPIEKS